MGRRPNQMRFKIILLHFLTTTPRKSFLALFLSEPFSHIYETPHQYTGGWAAEKPMSSKCLIFAWKTKFYFCVILLGSDDAHRLFETQTLAKALPLLPTHLMTIFCFAHGQDFTPSFVTWRSSSSQAEWKTDCYWHGGGQSVDVKNILRLCMIFDLLTNHKLLLSNKHYIFTDILYQPFNLLLRSLKLILHEMLPKVLG